MAGIGKIIIGTFLLLIAIALSFTIIGLILGIPLFGTALTLINVGFAELGFKTTRAVIKATRDPQ